MSYQDILALHHRQLARRTWQSPAEYAASIYAFRRPTNWRMKALAVALVAGAVVMAVAK